MKTTWILTTGSSDIQLNTNDNWNLIYEKIAEECEYFDFPAQKNDNNSKLFFVPIRPLGLAYSEENLQEQYEEYYHELVFPLIDGFSKKLQEENIKPERIILLLTNQEHIFENRGMNCPYWQDTCKAQHLFEKYFQKHEWLKKAEFIPLILEPQAGEKGLDSWDSALPLVQKILNQVKFEKDEEIYVSHQAGTPAISSALQFVSLGQFDRRVKFLVGNEYNSDEVDILESSTYLRGIQIQKAKKLITDGFPGAALDLLKDWSKVPPGIDTQIFLKLKRLVDIFNIKATVNEKDKEKLEFKPDNSIERVSKALDLIEKFFEQENYIQGIALLAAAQETFLKAAIYHLVKRKNEKIANINIIELIRWDNSGLFLKSKRSIEKITGFNDLQDRNIDLAAKLSFPRPEERAPDDRDPDYKSFWGKYIYRGESHFRFQLSTIYKNRDEENPRNDFELKNSRLFKWLQELIYFQDWEWELLKWSCQHIRDREQDKRNQLMHNLRGVKKEDVIYYLYGNPKNEADKKKIDDTQDVSKVYIEQVKQPFVSVISRLGWKPFVSNENKLQKELEALADKLR